MPESLIALLIGTVLACLISYLYWTRRKHQHREAEPPNEAGAFCVWCLYRRGDVCIHPSSPVYSGECGSVCIGHVRCEVRQERLRS
jgi:hypothetical protein